MVLYNRNVYCIIIRVLERAKIRNHELTTDLRFKFLLSLLYNILYTKKIFFMPHISSKKLKKENLQRLYDEFSSALEKSAKKSWSKLFLSDLLTHTEKIMLAKRFAVIYLLSKDIPLSYISDALCMSPTTIFKMSLKYDIGKYSSLLKTIKDEDIWEILEKILKAGLPPRAGRGRWKFLYK